jgi:hypothetical protein
VELEHAAVPGVGIDDELAVGSRRSRSMVGTLQLARALTDCDLSDQLLARGVETALKLLDDRA